MVRSSEAALGRSAVAALREALERSTDVTLEAETDEGGDLRLRLPDGRRLRIDVKAAAHASPGLVSKVLGEERGSPDPVRVLVADDIPDAAKALLRKAGWGWLDRRGHLYLEAPGVLINDTTIEALPRRPDRVPRDPIRGRGGLSVAAALLLSPEDPPGVREIAREAGMAPSTISEALADIREASLLRADGRPLVPELFWTLADAWAPSRVPLADHPDPKNAVAARRYTFGLDGAGDGWALSGTVAAVAWGAPMAASGDYPPDFYIPAEAHLRGLEQRYGPSRWEGRAATVATTPTPYVTSRRYPSGETEWPLAHPLFVALDLARDGARGAEILEGWTPPDPFVRVW